jgi:hypothetical protein
MTWNYRIFKETDKLGEDWFTVREVYYTESEEIEAYSAEPANPGGVTVEELRSDIEHMLQALEKPILDRKEVDAKLSNGV